jgi:hypothetical protein
VATSGTGIGATQKLEKTYDCEAPCFRTLVLASDVSSKDVFATNEAHQNGLVFMEFCLQQGSL